jgi:hypothetical protein
MTALHVAAMPEHRAPASGRRREPLKTLRMRLVCLPAAMRAARRWLLFKPGKVPYYASGEPRHGELDSPADVASLVTLDEALHVLERDGRFAGLGFALGFDAALGAYWQGLDLDDALDGRAFTTQRARELYEASEGYAEVSPSGLGFHVIGLGPSFQAVKWKRRGEQAIEAYSAGRYFTVTGRVMREGDPADLAPLVASIRADLIARGRAREQGARVTVGAAGDYLARQSEGLREWLEAHPIEEALRDAGYEQSGDRWLSPRSESGIPGVVILDRLRAVTFHASDAGIGTPTATGDGEVFNAFDVAARYRFNDDRQAAMRELLRPGGAQEPASEANAGGMGSNANRAAGIVWGEPANVFRDVAAPRFERTDVPAPIHVMAEAFSAATGFDYSGAVVAATVAAAAVIDDRYRLAVQPRSDWFESARLWAVLIGTPSVGKSPTTRAATDPVKRMHGERFAAWAGANSGRKPEERDPLPALFTSDATVEALADALRDNPRGLLMLTEEFASWIGGIDAYRDGAGAKNRGEWLQLYDGGPHQVNRVRRGAFLIPNWGASVLAACTPAGLRDQLRKLPDDGLIQRFIPCLMSAPTATSGASARSALQEWEARLRDVYTLSECSEPRARLHMSPHAAQAFEAEARSIREAVDSLYEMSPPLASHVGKHPGMLARVALTFHVIEGRAGDDIEADTMETAIRFMRKVRRHAGALYLGILAASPALELCRAIARAIVADSRRPASIGRHYMLQACRAFRHADDLTRRLAVQSLEDAGWLAPVPGSRAYGGWGASEWAVNPHAFERFAAEGVAHRERRATVRALMTGDHAAE